ncbi:MAG: histidine kinase [Nostoc sp.]|uniref:histidine kinase n=1 Tax=Nostoc sp. TaxID=1180 RepID=UPI002FF60707
MGDEGAGGAELITNECPMPHAQCPMPNAPCPMPHAQPLIYRLIISLCGTFFVKIKVELWH